MYCDNIDSPPNPAVSNVHFCVSVSISISLSSISCFSCIFSRYLVLICRDNLLFYVCELNNFLSHDFHERIWERCLFHWLSIYKEDSVCEWVIRMLEQCACYFWTYCLLCHLFAVSVCILKTCLQILWQT